MQQSKNILNSKKVSSFLSFFENDRVHQPLVLRALASYTLFFLILLHSAAAIGPATLFCTFCFLWSVREKKISMIIIYGLFVFVSSAAFLFLFEMFSTISFFELFRHFFATAPHSSSNSLVLLFTILLVAIPTRPDETF